MRTLRGKLVKSAKVIEGHYGNVKDEWAIIGTGDETHTKACGAGQRSDGSKKFIMADGYTYTWDANIK